jgi:hypothetical protein
MLDSGNISPSNPTNYSLENLTTGLPVNLNSITYTDAIFTAWVNINGSSSAWTKGNQYRFTIGSGLENRCGTPQGVDVEIVFETIP